LPFRSFNLLPSAATIGQRILLLLLRTPLLASLVLFRTTARAYLGFGRPQGVAVTRHTGCSPRDG
jgi:hypothetical protein